jgi:hypothetical protein
MCVKNTGSIFVTNVATAFISLSVPCFILSCASEFGSGLACEKKAVVTGSALNAALGLDTLKKQQEHFDFVKYGKLKPEPNSDAQERMKHGTDNEINAVATLVTKILPVFSHICPSLSTTHIMLFMHKFMS